MKNTHDIITLVDDLADSASRLSDAYAELTPEPMRPLVKRVGAIRAEMFRQYGRFTISQLQGLERLARVAWTGYVEIAEATEQAYQASAETLKATAERVAETRAKSTEKIREQIAKGAKQIERNFSIVGSTADEVAADMVDEVGDVIEDSARDLDVAIAEAAGAAGDTGRVYEEWTKEELYERAQLLDIDGRSQMNKDELLEAVRAA